MSDPTPILPGKLPAGQLAALLGRYAQHDPQVVVGPAIGLDATAIALGDTVLVAKSDPITFATDQIGWYAVHVNANDVACLGARPRWFLATLLLPESNTTPALVEQIFAQINSACAELGVVLVGGHTEITFGLDRPIVVGQMLGTVAPDKLITPLAARAGDKLLLAKPFPIEATAIIGHERAAELAARGYDQATIVNAQQALFAPGLSVVRAAQVAASATLLHGMHDPTEGGLATGVRELAQAAGLGFCVEQRALPLFELGARLCTEFGLDPLGVIASGSLLLAVPPEGEAPLLAAFQAASIPAATIGTLTPDPAETLLLTADGPVPWPSFAVDEITKLFM
jgi:hydrogenase expression/formation protein HypE